MEARKNSGGSEYGVTNGSITISPPASSIDYIRSQSAVGEKFSIDIGGDLPPPHNSQTMHHHNHPSTPKEWEAKWETNKIHVFSDISQNGNGDSHLNHHNNHHHPHHNVKYSSSSSPSSPSSTQSQQQELNNAGDSSLVGNNNANGNNSNRKGSGGGGEFQLTQRKGQTIKSDHGNISPTKNQETNSYTYDHNMTTTTTTTAIKNQPSTCMDKEKTEQEEDTTEDFGLHVFNSCPNPLLLQLTDMPAHLQFNKFVHSGYRRLHDFWGCFWSLFYLHNETVNIFTHVIPIIWVLTYWRDMYPWEEIKGNTFLNILGWSHVIASISPWLGSVVYHLFMNHEKGARMYNLLLQMDMFGIWVTECFGALTNLSASTWCLPGHCQTIIIVLYAVGSVWGLQKAMTAWTPMGRRMCFAPVFITRILGFFLRISPYGGGEPSILLHVILQDAVSLVGGMIGVIRIPEIWFPGKLDFFCNSHHIMHVLVVLAVFHMNLATNGDIRWIIGNYSQTQCQIPPAV